MESEKWICKMRYHTANILGVLLQGSSNPSYRHNVQKQHMALSDLSEYIFQFSVVRKSKCEPMCGRWRWLGLLLLKCIFAPNYSAHVDASLIFFFLHLMCLYSFVDSALFMDSFVQKLQDFSVRNSFACLVYSLSNRSIYKSWAFFCAKNSFSWSHCKHIGQWFWMT